MMKVDNDVDNDEELNSMESTSGFFSVSIWMDTSIFTDDVDALVEL